MGKSEDGRWPRNTRLAKTIAILKDSKNSEGAENPSRSGSKHPPHRAPTAATKER